MADKIYNSEDIQALCAGVSLLLRTVREQKTQIDRVLKRPPLQRLYVTRQEAAAMIGISTRTLDRMIDRGALGTLKHSKAIILSVREIERLELVRRKGGLPQDELNLEGNTDEAC